MNEYVVIGLGSMGKRRIRCLMSLGVVPENIWGMDSREDRRGKAKEDYGIKIAMDESQINFNKVKAIIVSLPPDKHNIGIDIAIRYSKPVFVEASVIIEDAKKVREASKHIFLAPSCTFVFHPIIKEIKKIVSSGRFGKVCNFSYHSGQYLPDWHPWENVKDFYVSKRETGGAREIVPYELTWITDLFGFPEEIKGFYRKTGETGCNIEDSYVCIMSYGNMVGMLLVDVVSRYPARNLIINLECGQIQWRWDTEQIEVYDALSRKRFFINQGKQKHENGYSTMIGEDMYREELESFLTNIHDPAKYPNTLEKDIKVLELLTDIENSDGGFDR